ncbi:MAG: cysteine desulfurase family protein [Verrucomicrobiota bacterium]
MIRTGRISKLLIERAREKLADLLSCEPRELIWTSGGTEANTLAILSAVEVTGKNHIVTSTVEHHAVSEVIDYLQKKGCAVTRIPVDASGKLDPNQIAEAIRDQTALVTCMWGNNETGVLFPIRKIGQICRDRDVLFHVDGVQAVGKTPISLTEEWIDSMAVSGHKIHGPKGIGALYLRRRTPFITMIPGGGQEKGRRGGTENLPGIIGMGKAAELAADSLPLFSGSIPELRQRLETELKVVFPDMKIHGEGSPRLTNTSSMCFPGIDGEALLLGLDRRGVSVSTGSACATGALEPSHVLLAMGVKRKDALATIRVSLGKQTTQHEIESSISAIIETVQELISLSPT